MAFTITSFTGNYGLVNADRGNLRKAIDTVAQTITLDTSLGASWACNIENANTGSTLANNSLVFKPSSGTVDGASTFTSYRGEVRGVSCDGTNWLTICIRMGDARFDGYGPLVKNLDGANQRIHASMWSIILGSDVTWSFPGNNTLSAFLSGGNATLTVQPATRYRFRSLLEVHNGGTTIHATFLGFLGSATYTDFKYQSVSGAGTAQGSGINSQIKQNIVATNSTVQVGITHSTFICQADGTFGTSAAGTIIPAFGMSADPTGTHVVKTGSYFECWAIGSNTVTSTGAWS